jgi:hypothetical protein
MDAVQRRVLAGNVTSMDEYKQLAGRLEGMREILGIRAVVQNMIRAERDRRDEQPPDAA